MKPKTKPNTWSRTLRLAVVLAWTVAGLLPVAPLPAAYAAPEMDAGAVAAPAAPAQAVDPETAM